MNALHKRCLRVKKRSSSLNKKKENQRNNNKFHLIQICFFDSIRLIPIRMKKASELQTRLQIMPFVMEIIPNPINSFPLLHLKRKLI